MDLCRTSHFLDTKGVGLAAGKNTLVEEAERNGFVNDFFFIAPSRTADTWAAAIPPLYRAAPPYRATPPYHATPPFIALQPLTALHPFIVLQPLTVPPTLLSRLARDRATPPH